MSMQLLNHVGMVAQSAPNYLRRPSTSTTSKQHIMFGKPALKAQNGKVRWKFGPWLRLCVDTALKGVCGIKSGMLEVLENQISLRK